MTVEDEQICECDSTMLTYFHFSDYCFNLEPYSGRCVSVIFRNIDYVGDYFEKFQLKIHQKVDGDLLLFDCKVRNDLCIR